MQAIILCGGFGTRLSKMVNDRQKTMADISGKPFLYYTISNLKKQGIKDIILCTGHMAEGIKDYFKDGKDFGVTIQYSHEDKPLGTAGAIKNAENLIKEDFIVLNGDAFFDINFDEFINFSKKKKSTVIALKRVEDTSRYGVVNFDEDLRIINFTEKPGSEGKKSGFINGGIYLLKKETLKEIPKDKKVSIEREIFPRLIKNKKVFAFTSDNYFIDIGLPETYQEFISHIKEKK